MRIAGDYADGGAADALETIRSLAMTLRDSAERAQTEIAHPLLSAVYINRIQELLEVCLLSTRTLANACRPVNRLPSFLLAEIISLSRGGERSEFTASRVAQQSGEIQHSPYHWLFATHVCRYWRTSALQTPSLWTRIYVDNNLSLLRLFLERSFPLPVRVLCGSQMAIRSSAEEVAQAPEIAAAVLRLIDRNAQRLEALEFSSTFPIEAVLQRDHFSRVLLTLPGSTGPPARPSSLGLISQIFSADAADMRDLSLHALPISQFLRSESRYRHLVHLSLYDQPHLHKNQGSHPCTLRNFFDVLQSSSATLESVKFVRCGPQDDLAHSSDDLSLPSAERREINLSRLNRLEIGDWHSSGIIAHFLAHLRIPSNATRCIWGPEIKYLSSLLFSSSVTGSHLEAGEGQIIPGINTRGADATITRIVLSSTRGPDMAGVEKGTVFIQGSIDFTRYYPLFRDHPRVFSWVTHLCLGPLINEPSEDEYPLLLGVLPSLTCITTRELDLTILLKSFGLLDVTYLRDGDHVLPVAPNLLQLDIQYLDQSDNCERADPFGREVLLDPLPLTIALAILAEKRAKLGYPLEKLRLWFGGRIGHSDDFEEVLLQIRKWVEQVEMVGCGSPEKFSSNGWDLLPGVSFMDDNIY